MAHRFGDFIFDPTRVPDPDFRAPDLAGTVEGWRAWGIPIKTHFGVPPKLYSVSHDYYWAPRQAGAALCRHSCKDIPGESCSCGFYSAKDLSHLMSMNYHAYDADRHGLFHVVGQVANWGKVIEGSAGWRSQFSYPVSLYVPYEAHRLATLLGESYGVPVKLKNILDPKNRKKKAA